MLEMLVCPYSSYSSYQANHYLVARHDVQLHCALDLLVCISSFLTLDHRETQDGSKNWIPFSVRNITMPNRFPG